jgi:hypothetical protein
MTVLASDIIFRALDLLDIPQTSAWVNSTGVLAATNTGYRELYDLIISVNQDHFTKKATSLPTVAGISTVALPSDFLRMRYIYVVNGGTRYPLSLLEFKDRENLQTSDTGQPEKYRILGSLLLLDPTPNAIYQLEFWYIPNLTLFVATSIAMDSSIPEGWDNFITMHLAAYLANRKEEDPSYYLQEKANIGLRIKTMASHRDQAHPRTVIDVNNWMMGGA